MKMSQKLMVCNGESKGIMDLLQCVYIKYGFA